MSRLVSWVLLLVGVLAVAGALWWLSADKAGGAAAAPPHPFVLPATLASVERGALEARAQLTGTVRSLQEARLGFPVGGWVADIAVREGDVVKKGERLAALDDRDQTVRLASAKADTALARRELEALEAPTRPEELRRLEAQVQMAEAEAAWARAEAERMKGLSDSRIVSASTYEELVAKRDAAEARISSAKESLALGRAGAREEDRAVQRARVATREAAEAQAQREIDKTRIDAPFDGQVVRRLVAAGNAVLPGQAVLELVDLGHRYVEVEIPARHAARVGKDPRVDLAVDELPGFSLAAKLDAQLRAADERSRSFRGLVRLGEGVDDEGALRPGTFVRVTLHLQPLTDRLLVPLDAVRLVEQGSIVVRALPPAPPPAGAPAAPKGPGMPPLWKAEWVPVRVLGAVEGRAAVEPIGVPLAAGDKVVVVGVDRMFPGAPILPREGVPGAPPGGAAAPGAKAP